MTEFWLWMVLPVALGWLLTSITEASRRAEELRQR